MTTLRQKRAIKLAKSRVLKRKDITDDLIKLWIEKPVGYIFKPGQYCTIGIGGIERAYSIVSAPHEESLELFVELVPLADGGNLTPMIWDLNIGDSVTIRPKAKGIFTFKPQYKNLLLVATVTGVVPYISFIRDYIHRNATGDHFYVLMGASYKDEFTYDTELKLAAMEYPELFTFVPTVSRPSEERNSGWTGETGRVNLIVEKYLAEFGLKPEDTLIYACGHPGMIEDVKERVTPGGWPCLEERFWKDE